MATAFQCGCQIWCNRHPTNIQSIPWDLHQACCDDFSDLVL